MRKHRPVLLCIAAVVAFPSAFYVILPEAKREPETDRPEEFPIFTDWWLGKPQPDDANGGRPTSEMGTAT